MPTKLGEYCLRCGKKCEITNDGTHQTYSCPDHGIQLIEAAPPQQAAESAPPEQDSQMHAGVEEEYGQQQ